MTPFCHSFAFLHLCPIMRASFGSSRSAGLHIGGRPTKGSKFEQVSGGSCGLPSVAIRAPLVSSPSVWKEQRED